MPTFDLKELGATGLARFSGDIFEEQLPELRGHRGRKVIRQMSDGDAVVGSLLFAVEMLIRQVRWDIAPISEESEAEDVAEFVYGALFQDMSHTWTDTLCEILSFLPFGWSYLEIIYKTRNGLDTQDSRRRSQFTDGRVGWRKWSIRSQESLDGWEFDESGGVSAMRQIPSPDYRLRTIPIDKALLFRTTSRKGNPEGRSILRAAYSSWYYKSNIQRIEGIGIERDLAGLPLAYVPPELLSSDANATQRQILAEVKKIVTNIRRDEQEGVIFPRIHDESGHPLYELTLLSTGGQRQFDTDKVIERYDQRILMSVLADFLLLGHEKVGSFALADNKTSLFSIALGAWLDSICDVVNRYAIPKLLRVNAINPNLAPSLTHSDVEDVSLKDLAEYVSKLSGAGIPFDSPKVKTHLYERANLPVPANGFEEEDDETETETETETEPATDTNED